MNDTRNNTFVFSNIHPSLYFARVARSFDLVALSI
jgi:hypothetical protein